MLRPLGAPLAACFIAACAVIAHQPERLPDGSYRATCTMPLTTCLQVFDRLCEAHGYDVISASESRNRSDLREIPDVTVASEARVRCKPGVPLFGAQPAPSASPSPAPEPNSCREGS